MIEVKTTEQTGQGLYKKILAVMRDVGYLQKDDDVKAGYSSYKAITEEKVTGMVGASMRKHGLIILPIEVKQKREDMEVQGKNGPRLDRLTTVDCLYKIIDTETGESETIASAGTGIDTQDKGIGKALTYAYKYLLLRTFAIPTGEDPDKVASEDDLQVVHQNPKPLPAGAITESNLKSLSEFAKMAHGEEKGKKVVMAMIQHYGGGQWKNLKDDQMEAYSDWITSQ